MSNWFLLVLLSAITLGIYDTTRKLAMKGNAVLPVLFWATSSGTAFLVLIMLLTGRFSANWHCGWETYGFVWLKALLVSASWYCGYAAMLTLPLSLAAPVNASRPLWVFLGGLLIYHEVPTFWKGVGMALIFIGYYMLNGAGGKEGFTFRKSSGMKYCLAGAMLGSASALYDKFLLNIIKLPPQTVQLHFAIDLVILFGAALLFAYGCRMKITYHWHVSIPATGILLIIADCIYFYALSIPDVHISQVSLIRRCSCLVTFLMGVIWFKERNIRGKLAALLLILAGVVVMALF